MDCWPSTILTHSLIFSTSTGDLSSVPSKWRASLKLTAVPKKTLRVACKFLLPLRLDYENY